MPSERLLPGKSYFHPVTGQAPASSNTASTKSTCVSECGCHCTACKTKLLCQISGKRKLKLVILNIGLYVHSNHWWVS
ncbi:UNVERIFIED_CONTAM: hypothetical protein FKN15_060834 [Acipenser sinensis]